MRHMQNMHNMQHMSFWFTTSAAVECGFLQCSSRHIMVFHCIQIGPCFLGQCVACSSAHVVNMQNTSMHNKPFCEINKICKICMFTDEQAGGIMISRIIFKYSRLRTQVRSNIISQQTQVTQAVSNTACYSQAVSNM
jgi:hypothetical protein